MITFFFEKRKDILNKLTKERLNKITELINETKFDDLLYYYKNMMNRKRFDGINNVIKAKFIKR